MGPNPFLKPSTPVPRPINNQRVQNLQAIAQDVQARTAKVQHLRALGQQAQADIKNTAHSGSSRLSWLAQQLNKDK